MWIQLVDDGDSKCLEFVDRLDSPFVDVCVSVHDIFHTTPSLGVSLMGQKKVDGKVIVRMDFKRARDFRDQLNEFLANAPSQE